MVGTGDTVKWSNGRKPLGVVVHTFYYKHQRYAVVEKSSVTGGLTVVRDCEDLLVVTRRKTFFDRCIEAGTVTPIERPDDATT